MSASSATSWRKANPEKARAAQRKCRMKWRDKYNEKRRINRRKAAYGIEHGDFIAMLEVQQHRCAICPTPIDSRAHLDHDHLTGKVRGILCGRCNVGLGMFGDSPDVLTNAIEYLKKERH
jgi:hypothetical protein